MKHTWIAALVIALVANQALAAPALSSRPPDARLLPVYEGIRQVALRSCANPALTGWTITAKGSGEVGLKPTILAKLLTDLNIKLAAGTEYGRWSGMLQRDAAAAFANRNDCVAKLFEVMAKSLPVTDQMGRLLPKPAHPDMIYRALIAQSNSNQVEQTQSIIGNTASSGPQINSTAPSNNVAVTGGQNTLVFSPPVTPDEKLRAHDALIEELRQLAAYPERDEIAPAPTIAQEHFSYTYPRALYIRLSKYYDSTIATVPHGDELISYERAYYNYSNLSRNLERRAIIELGAFTDDQQSYTWRTYYEYCLTRAMGFDASAIKSGNGQIVSGTYDEAEKACDSLKRSQHMASELNELGQGVGRLTRAAADLLSHFQ